MEWLRRQLRKSDLGQAVGIGIALGIIIGIFTSVYLTPVAETAHADAEVLEVVEPVEVLVKVIYTEEDIIRKIKETFVEDPQTAVKIARCESGLRIKIQSQHQLSYGQERSFGLFQIHAPDWHKVALKLGYEDYQTDIDDNLAMARYIYDNAGRTWRDWSCYTKKMI